MKSIIDHLTESLELIKQDMFELIDNSRILRFRNDPSSQLVFISPEYYWDEPNEDEQRIQIRIKKRYSKWVEPFNLLIENAPMDVKNKTSEIKEFIVNWIEKESSWGLPKTLQEAKLKFENEIKPLYETLQLFNKPGDREIIIIPDTNALINKPNPLNYKEFIDKEKFTIAILPTVLSELDDLKTRNQNSEFQGKVKSVIKRLKGYRNQGNLLEGIIVEKTICIKMFAVEPNFDNNLSWLDKDNNDDRIIAGSIEIQRSNPSDYVFIATGDINLQNKAEMAFLPYFDTN